MSNDGSVLFVATPDENSLETESFKTGVRKKANGAVEFGEDMETALPYIMRENYCAGVIAFTEKYTDLFSEIDVFEYKYIPFVSVRNKLGMYSTNYNTAFVGSDYVKAGKDIARVILNAPHENGVLIVYNDSISSSLSLKEGLIKKLSDNGVTVSSIKINSSATAANIVSTVRQQLETNEYSVITCYTDALAFTLLPLCEQYPNLRLVGFGGTKQWKDYVQNGGEKIIASYKEDYEKLGELAAEKMNEFFKNNQRFEVDGEETIINGAVCTFFDPDPEILKEPISDSEFIEEDSKEIQNYNGGSISEDIETDPEYARKSFTLPCGGEVSLNLATGKSKFVFSDCVTEDSPIGVSVAHVFDKENNASRYGANFGLNLDESLTVNDDGNYVYTDGLGRTHTCETKYYIIDDSGGKRYAPKSEIEVKADGELKYYDKKVEREACLESGLTFGGELKGAFKNLKYFEQRSDEIKQLEEQKESYEKVFKDFVIVDQNFEIINSAKQFKNEHAGEFYSEPSLFEQFLLKIKTTGTDSEKTYLLTNSEVFNGKSLLIQKADSGGSKQIFYEQQITALLEDSEENVKTLKKYFIVYLKVLSDLEKYKKEQAVNYASDGKIVKAFRSDGKLVAIIDAYENTVTFEYTDNGKLTGVYSGDRKEIKIKLDDRYFYPVKIVDGRGRKIAYTYNGGLLKTITYPDETTLTFEYSSIDGITSITDSNGKKTNFVYTNGKLTSVKNYAVQGSTETLLTEYTVAYAPTKTTITAKNREEVYNFTDGKLKSYAETFNGRVIEAEIYSYTPYEAKHIERSKKNMLNKSHLSSFVYMKGEAVDIVLNKFNLPVKKTITGLDENAGIVAKVETQYEYNADNLCVKTEVKSYKANTATPFITTISTTDYNPQGKVMRTESYVVEDKAEKGKNIVEYFYDDKGRETKRLAYNSLDTGSKFCEEHTYDDIGRELSSTTETGEITSYEYYDDTASLRSVKYPDGAVIAYGKDITDNVTAITQSTEDGEENSTLRRYYDNGLTKKVESGNTKIEYEYDVKDRVTQIKLNGDTKATIAYAEDVTASDGTSTDETTVTNAKGETIKTTTDKAGNVRSVKFNDVEQWNATYTKNGEVKALEDKITGKTEENYFDKYGRKFAYIIEDDRPYKEEYSYDDYGNVLKAKLGSREYVYSYNNDSARTLKGVSTGGVSFERKTDKAGRNAGKVITQGSTEIAKESIRYLKFGDRATNLPFAVDFKDGRITYKYDKVGNIKEIRENGEIVAKYKYDTLGRLVREDNKPFAKTVTYTYDNCGNILEKRTYAYTLADDIEEKDHTTVSYKYDGDKLLKYGSETCVYDVLGNPTTYRGKTATWEKGRLKTYNGVTLGYDGRGKRISSGSLNFEYSSDGKLLKRSDGLEFIYDLQGLAGVVDNSDSTIKTYFYRKDAQGNIVALLDKNGAVVVKYVYNAWGEHKVLNPDGTENTSASFIGNINPFRYRGYYYDKALKLYYLVTRYYDPVVGRFISQDSFEYADPDTINGLNLYAYCNNNPVMNVDPTGKWSWRGFWNVLAAVAIVAAVTALTVVTAGAATVAIAGAMGASALTTAVATVAVMGTAAVTGIIGGVGEIVTQTVDKGIDNINLGSVAIKSFTNAADGALVAGSVFTGVGGKLLIANARFTLTSIMTNLYGMSEGWSKEKTQNELDYSILGIAVGTLFSFAFSGSKWGALESVMQPLTKGAKKVGELLFELLKRIVLNK